MPTIQYAKTLLCNSPEIITLTLEAFERMVSERRGYAFTWADASVTPDGHEIASNLAGYDPAILDKLVVCDMGPSLGLGIYAKSVILKGTSVACYTGIVSGTAVGGDHYILSAAAAAGEEKKYVSARTRGNVAGFFQHISSPSVHKYFVEEAALPNLSVSKSPDGGFWLVATRDIEANEQLGYPYDTDLSTYWGSLGIIPTSFDRFGRKLPYDGSIFYGHIFPLLVHMASYLKDTEWLANLSECDKDLYDSVIRKQRHDELGLLGEIVDTAFHSHKDILRLLYPEDRQALLKILAGKPILDPVMFDSTGPYAGNRVAAFVDWKEVDRRRFFPSLLKFAEL